MGHHITTHPLLFSLIAGVAALSPLDYPIFAGDNETLSRWHFNSTTGTAKWTPKHPDTLLSYISTQPFSSKGARVSVSFSWESSGSDVCPSSSWGGDGCVANKCDSKSAYESVHCVGGTGDFRIGMFDSTGGGRVKGSGFCPTTSYDGMATVSCEPSTC